MIGLILVAGAALPALLTPGADCRQHRDDEIVVCGTLDDADARFRLPPLPDTYTPDYVTMKLPGGASLTPHAVAGRLSDPQARLTLTIPF